MSAAVPTAPDELVDRLLRGEHTEARNALYRELRSVGPLLGPGAFPGYIAIGYEWCREAMRKGELQKLTTTQVGHMIVGLQTPEPGNWVHPVFMQDENHRRLKLLFASLFSAKQVRNHQAHFEAIADEEVGAIVPGEPYDLMRGAALRVPGRFIGETIGFPDEVFDEIQPWVHDVAMALEPWATPDVYERGAEGAKQITVALNPLVRARRRDPHHDLLSALVHDTVNGEPLPKRSITALCIMAYTAGYETTMSLIGNTVLTLARIPGLFERVKADRSLLPALLEESMRYESPTHFAPRIAVAPVDVLDQHFDTGDVVVITIGAAHHDPEVFPDPERFDLTRPSGRVLTFAPGPAHCCGEVLGRLEAETVVGRLVDRFDRIELLDDEIEWRPGALLHGPEHLNLRFS